MSLGVAVTQTSLVFVHLHKVEHERMETRRKLTYRTSDTEVPECDGRGPWMPYWARNTIYFTALFLLPIVVCALAVVLAISLYQLLCFIGAWWGVREVDLPNFVFAVCATGLLCVVVGLFGVCNFRLPTFERWAETGSWSDDDK